MGHVTAENIRRKEGDTYPILAEIKDGATIMDLSGATAIQLGISASRSGGTVTVIDGALDSDGTDGMLKFDDQAKLGAIAAGKHFAEITFQRGGYIYTTPTFSCEIEEQIIA